MNLDSEQAEAVLSLDDQSPAQDDFLAEVLAGLNSKPKTLPCKYFYDAEGAKLFEQICTVDEYYPTRTELSIMRQHGAAIAEAIGPAARVVEYGSGEGIKTRLLLSALENPAAYVPIDISLAQLRDAASKLQQDFPQLEVLPLCADYQADIQLPKPAAPCKQTVVYFPGSTLGNFEREAAQAFLQRLAKVATSQGRGGVLLGVDLVKDPSVLEAAYADAAGITAAFNLNLLKRINRELGANFQLEQFQHEARWNAELAAIEMHLVSQQAQQLQLAGQVIEFAAGESLLTEYSHKYQLANIASMAKQAGLSIKEQWLDEQGYFAVLWLS